MTTTSATSDGALTATATRSLDQRLLDGFRARAADHDAAGSFPLDDLAELRASGWLAAAAPTSRGGLGLNLAEVGAEQRRLARYAPATALATATGIKLRGFHSNSSSSTASSTAAIGVPKVADMPPAAPATSSVFRSEAVM